MGLVFLLPEQIMRRNIPEVFLRLWLEHQLSQEGPCTIALADDP